MQSRVFVDDDALVPAVLFTGQDESLLTGTLSYPVPSFLTAEGALRLVESADRLIAWGTAMKMRGLARAEEAVAEEQGPRRAGQPGRFGGDEAHAIAVTEVATTCALSEGAAARSLNDAADYATSHWQVLEGVEEGDISVPHARVIQDMARSLPAEQAEEFTSIAIRRLRTRQGRRRTPAELRVCLRRLQESLNPESLIERKKSAQRERGVWFAPEPDGMCTLTAYLSAEVGLAIFNGLSRDARLAGAKAAEFPSHSGQSTPAQADDVPDARTLPEYRADALVHRLLGGNEDSEFGTFRPEIVVTIPVRHVLGGSNGSTGASELAELDGYGPLDTRTARRLAALAPNWQRLFTDCTTGEVLGVGRAAYRPPKSLLRYLQSRDGTCRFPGCQRRATVCEPDHTVEWQDGGTTDAGNLAMLCRRHHALKSIGAWKYRQLSGAGDLVWRSPAGRCYKTAAASFDSAPDPPKPPELPPF